MKPAARFTLLLAGSLIAGCARHPPASSVPRPAHNAPTITIADGIASMELSVVTYNVAALPFPARRGANDAVARIRAAMVVEWAGDRRPDVLLLQEAFLPSASRLTFDVGYSHHLRGPKANSRRALKIHGPDEESLGRRQWRRGEGWPKVTNSGLALGTNLGVIAHIAEPFGRRSCAGLDCLANKGVTLTTLEIPGVPEPVMILNTHLNSRRAANVSLTRTDFAHRQQVREMIALLAREWRGRFPLIYAGDFNTRGTPFRFDYKDERLPGELAHRFCHSNPQKCRIEISWDGDEPWRDTQDLQGYASSARVQIEPVAIAAEFDEPVGDRRLSDHDALRVTYKLSWRIVDHSANDP